MVVWLIEKHLVLVLWQFMQQKINNGDSVNVCGWLQCSRLASVTLRCPSVNNPPSCDRNSLTTCYLSCCYYFIVNALMLLVRHRERHLACDNTLIIPEGFLSKSVEGEHHQYQCDFSTFHY